MDQIRPHWPARASKLVSEHDASGTLRVWGQGPSNWQTSQPPLPGPRFPLSTRVLLLGTSTPYYHRLLTIGGARPRLSSRRPSSSRPSSTPRGFQQPPTPEPSAAWEHPDLCDERLKHIKILNWTQVPISNELAARLIAFYLVVDHPVLGLFDADLFLGDLVAHKTEFCCPLLLTAVLSFACVRVHQCSPAAFPCDVQMSPDSGKS